ncbi:DUF998 domain-containing protein [Aquihabitans sp. G128]|uniref:DUF998 domain-containing protein n=1 Tax=Aquihabitans sp. G128 TaxID=2849779 RepID=UPI001C23E5A4|nr:DUF998 domain-containing protein [Aquihabitans sp. G128]QXC60918.1 DUF998 domain-containing protein [Aquihabitans sp. G128]
MTAALPARTWRPPRARWAGVAAVAVLWAGVGASVVRSGLPLAGALPLSRMAGDDRSSWLFGPALVVAAVLFLAWCTDVVRRHPVDLAFTVLMVAGMLGQMVAGIVPIGPEGSSDPVHVSAALLLGISIPVFLWRFAATQPTGPWRRTATRLFALQAAATVVGIGLSQAHVAPLAEILPALAFHLWVVVVTLHDPVAPGQPTSPNAANRVGIRSS